MGQIDAAEKILKALLENATVTQAAAAAGVSERTVYNYLNKPDFQKRYADAKAVAMTEAANGLAATMARAVQVIAGLMESETTPAWVRLQAARAILDHGIKVAEWTDTRTRLAALERAVEERQAEGTW